jgi:hypothetical protein
MSDPIHTRIALPTNTLLHAARILRNVLKSPAEAGVITRRTRGRVDVKRAHRALRGARDYRKQRWTQQEYTTAVSVVLDMSDSMDHQANILQAAARALGTVLQQAGNPYTIYGFTSDRAISGLTETKRHAGTNKEHDGGDWAGRFGQALEGEDVTRDVNRHESDEVAGGGRNALWEIVGLRDTMKSSEKRLAGICKANCRSGTPDANALFGAVELIRKVKANRHIVIMLTDGDGYGASYVKHATEYANSVGVETIGIGLLSKHITDGDGQYNACDTIMYPKYDRARQAGDRGKYIKTADLLSQGFFKSLLKQLRKGRTQAKRVLQ